MSTFPTPVSNHPAFGHLSPMNRARTLPYLECSHRALDCLWNDASHPWLLERNSTAAGRRGASRKKSLLRCGASEVNHLQSQSAKESAGRNAEKSAKPVASLLASLMAGVPAWIFVLRGKTSSRWMSLLYRGCRRRRQSKNKVVSPKRRSGRRVLQGWFLLHIRVDLTIFFVHIPRPRKRKLCQEHLLNGLISPSPCAYRRTT